jgi:hypothetical protein
MASGAGAMSEARKPRPVSILLEAREGGALSNYGRAGGRMRLLCPRRLSQ